MIADPQIEANGRLRHLLSIEGLPRTTLVKILDRAEDMAREEQSGTKKLPLLHGRTVVNLFFEPSTRTRTTFELAAKRLSADVVNVQLATSSTTKGETLLDTLRTLESMRVDLFVVRHKASGAAAFFARHATPDVSILNAGDGQHEHPTQALLDMFTLRRHLNGRPFSDLRVAIIGDILHSRVARSDIHALHTLGCRDIRVVGPRTLVPDTFATLGATPYHDFARGVEGANVLMLLRLQRERMIGALLPSAGEFHADFGLTEERLHRLGPDVIFMHPGPINRGVELAGALAYEAPSRILDQVHNGIAVRMAVMAEILGAAR
ncbi:MAG: aspartate carbamoyltransferase catalytic subunit [Nevskiaceae bacterium]|nr:MAG: aspartate carbamoyltransferase catalytic subunit [Nevskiaceae bacterium]TBR74309.1 MAG: aspartate carbamoyltransferase catalytic subunit [Nevskiaceae bacterium]